MPGEGRVIGCFIRAVIRVLRFARRLRFARQLRLALLRLARVLLLLPLRLRTTLAATAGGLP